MLQKTLTSKQIAQAWHLIGVNVIPIIKGSKQPRFPWTEYQTRRTTDQEIQKWWGDDPNKYDVGVVTGAISRISMIDLDVKDGKKGSDTAKELGIYLPSNDVLILKTPRGGFHLYVAYDERYGSNSNVQELIDTRNDGGYAKVHGTNEDGNKYSVLRGQISRQYFPKYFDRKLVLTKPHMSHKGTPDNADGNAIHEGSRNETLTSMVGKWKKKGMTDKESIALIKDTNRTQCVPPINDEAELLGIVNSVYSYDVAEIPIIDMSEVEEKAVEWLWNGWLPKGKITIIAGVEGVGKTFVLLDIATSITKGKTFPDGTSAPQGNVLFFGFEDGLADTVKSRLRHLGSDGKGIKALDWSKVSNLLSLKDSSFLKQMKDLIQRYQARLIIIDPLSSLLGEVNDSKETTIRPLLEELSGMAEETGVSMVLVKHFSKRNEMVSPTHNITGSVAFGGVVRGMNFIVPKKDDEGKTTDVKTLINVKNNLAKKQNPLDFEIGSDGISWTAGDPDYDYLEQMKPTRGSVPKEDCKKAVIYLLGNGRMTNQDLMTALKTDPYDFSTEAIRKGKALAIEDGSAIMERQHTGHTVYSLPDEVNKSTHVAHMDFGDVTI